MNPPALTDPHRGFSLSKIFDILAPGARITADRDIPFVTDDSRRAAPGCCFVAVNGNQVDGHNYVQSAIRAGAAVVVVEREVAAADGVTVIPVDDTRLALAKLAVAYYGLNEFSLHSRRTVAGVGTQRGAAAEQFQSRGRKPADWSTQPMSLAGITGTNGKTTVTWLVRAIFRAAKIPTALLGTIEYDLCSTRRRAPLTTPGALELCRHLATARDAGARAAVIEVSSHALEQRRCDGLSFAAAVLTNLSGEHLDYHNTMEDYAAAKARLFDLLEPEGRAVLNADDDFGRELRQRFTDAGGTHPLVYGLSDPNADVTAVIHDMHFDGSRITIRTPRGSLDLTLPLIGRHNVSNALAAVAVAEALGVAPDAVQAGLETISGVPGRLQRVEPEGCPFTVLVDYAHTDAALAHALQAVRPFTRNRLICVFGCGGDRDRGKRPRMAQAVGTYADLAVVTSDNPRMEDPDRIINGILAGFGIGGATQPQQIAGAGAVRIHVEPDRRQAIALALHEARDGDTVLIAGKGHEDYQEIGGVRIPFDDVAVAREILSEGPCRRG